MDSDLHVCDEKVSTLIQTYENGHNYDSYAGWRNGLNAVNQDKHYCQINIQNFERHRDQYPHLAHNVEFPRIRYVMHYLKEEPNFTARFPQHGSTFDFTANDLPCEAWR